MPLSVVHRPKSPKECVLLLGGFTESFYNLLKTKPWTVEEVIHGGESMKIAPEHPAGVIVCSLRMEGAWGLDVLDAILKADPLKPVIISTHERDPRVVVDSMQRGAFDYVTEPYESDEAVVSIIERAVSRRAALRDARSQREALKQRPGALSGLIGSSAALKQLCDEIRQVAPTPTPVLIEGPSGSGKELVARALHDASRRAGQPFVAVNCGAIAENLLESELFGHEKGAFTGADSTRVGLFEEANGGTLFLDEIGLMSSACQGKLLRTLETGNVRRVGASREFKVDVRVVAATNEPLSGLVQHKRFREDLFYRLNVVTLRVPPLSDRREDIASLSYHFALRFAQASGKAFEAFTPEALDALQAYSFPGNVRELRNIVERAVVFSRGPVISAHDLPETIRPRNDKPQDEISADARLAHLLTELMRQEADGLDEQLEQIERALILQALKNTDGNRSEAARRLKIQRTTLLQKMERLGLANWPETKKSRSRRK
ncbi:MAG TPA: sigma-54 dependent transcriptional regulator [Planctomycetota bacterium]|nr:sigma-54 dependent transcriptional regulator [Planctomycetota bacterium]